MNTNLSKLWDIAEDRGSWCLQSMGSWRVQNDLATEQRCTEKWFSYTYIYIFQIIFHYRLLQNIEHSSMCYIVGPWCLCILYIEVSICQSHLAAPCANDIHRLLHTPADAGCDPFPILLAPTKSVSSGWCQTIAPGNFCLSNLFPLVQILLPSYALQAHCARESTLWE